MLHSLYLRRHAGIVTALELKVVAGVEGTASRTEGCAGTVKEARSRASSAAAPAMLKKTKQNPKEGSGNRRWTYAYHDSFFVGSDIFYVVLYFGHNMRRSG